MQFKELVSWLFDKTLYYPQLGFAGKDKKAWLWLPGDKLKPLSDIKRIIRTAPIRGCSQLAYRDSYSPPSKQQICEICWVGLDIDDDDNPDLFLPQIGAQENFRKRLGASCIRTSCSGKGIHVIFKLDKPIECLTTSANSIIKRITAEKVSLCEKLGIQVCKADRRMFWLTGGRNYMLSIDKEATLAVDIKNLPEEPRTKNIEPELTETFEVTPTIKQWATSLGLQFIRRSNPVYVGDVVKLLREAGEKVITRSPCSGNGQTNGFLNVTRHSISLFAFADGRVIWNFTDVRGYLNDSNDHR